MKTVPFKGLRNSALGLALLAGAIVLPQNGFAGSIQDKGDFGGTWVPIAPSDHYDWRYADRLDFGEPAYVAPDYVYVPPVQDPDFFGPPVYEDYGPGVALAAPDAAVAIDID